MSQQSSASIELTVTLRIIVVAPVAGVAYGVQEGKGTGYKVSLLQTTTDQDLVFEVQMPVKKSDSGQPNFTGPLAQGPPAGRFVYLNIGKSAGQASTWDRRLKVPLAAITCPWLKEQFMNPSCYKHDCQAKLKMAVPSCATVQPIDGCKSKCESEIHLRYEAVCQASPIFMPRNLKLSSI